MFHSGHIPFGSHWSVIIRSGDGRAQIIQQAISWTSNDPRFMTQNNITRAYCVKPFCAAVVEYCKTSNIRCTKSQNFNAFRPILQLSFPNALKPGVKLRMKM